MKKFVALALAVILILSLSAVSFAKYKGDINSDGLVNSSDALAVLKYAVGIDKEINKAVADMNADEKINSSDALAILQVSVGIKEKEEVSDESMSELYYSKIVALKEKYPEGSTWKTTTFYYWKGGIYTGGGGCAGFAFMLSDAAFGDAAATKLENITIDDVRVGDILRINKDTLSVVVLEVHDDHVVVVGCTSKGEVRWERKLTADNVASATYLLTRYDTLPDKD